MIKNENGITIVSLVITIIVMLIIFGVTISSGTIILESSRKTKIETTLLLIKTRADAMAEEYAFDGDIEKLIYFSELTKFTASDSRCCVQGYYKGYTLSSSVNYLANNSGKLCYSLGGAKIPLIEKSNVNSLLNKMEAIYSGNGFSLKDSTIKANIATASKLGVAEGTDIPRFLSVKWGERECISNGILSATEKNSLINDDKDSFALVVYDLGLGEVVDVGYSKGFKYTKNDEVGYTLKTIRELDVVSEESD